MSIKILYTEILKAIQSAPGVGAYYHITCAPEIFGVVEELAIAMPPVRVRVDTKELYFSVIKSPFPQWIDDKKQFKSKVWKWTLDKARNRARQKSIEVTKKDVSKD